MTEIDEAEYIALTTFKRDGSALMTPVWVVPSELGYRVVTGKYERIRNNPAVTIAACNACGATRPGATRCQGSARILNDEEERAAALTARRTVRAHGPARSDPLRHQGEAHPGPFGPPVGLEIPLDEAHQADAAT